MFDVPVDALYVWFGVATVGVAVLGVAVALPTAAPPDATAAASAVDAVAVGPPGSRGSHDLRANRIRLGPSRIVLAGTGGRSHATFAYGPITPTSVDGRLERVLAGARPTAQFESQRGFEATVGAARRSEVTWRPAPDTLTVRRVSWGEVHVTLVG